MSKEALEAELAASAKKMGLSEEELSEGVELHAPPAEVSHSLDPEPEEEPEPLIPEEKEEAEAEAQAQGLPEPEPPKEPEKPKSDPDKAKERYKKSETERLLEPFKQAIADLTSRVEGLSKSPSGKEAADDWEDFTKDVPDANPAVLEKLYSKFESRLEKKLGVPADKLSVLDKLSATIAEQEAEKALTRLWEQALPKLKEQYPNATEQQYAAAREHFRSTAGKHNSDAEYALFKESAKFKDMLFSPKKKTAESGHLGDMDEPPDDTLAVDYEDLTPKKAQKLYDELDKEFSRKK
jgi:hypothetical protein